MKNKYIRETNYGTVRVVENAAYQWAVIDNQGNFIVPFGKYGWIDGFDSGLARVRTHTLSECLRDAVVSHFNLSEGGNSGVICDNTKGAKWGIINERGEEVLPLIYDNIWNFYHKNRFSTTVEREGKSTKVFFYTLNPALPIRANSNGTYYHSSDFMDYGNDYSSRYGKYADSYAQDVMGYSDDVIDDAFDGDPDAYWNID